MLTTDRTRPRDFLEELADIAADARRAAEARQAGIDPSPAARAERRRRVLLERDFEFFAYTYLGHHIRPPSSHFHRHFFGRYPQILDQPAGAKEWWIAPRGEAKSSLLTKVGPVWCTVRALLQRPPVRHEVGWPEDRPPPYFIDYIILLGAETRLPAKLIEVVKAELQYNGAIALDFPECAGATRSWKVGEIVTKTGVKIESFGAEQAIRGTFHGSARPKLLLGDDLITDKEASSPAERNARWEWLCKAVDYLGPPDGTVKYIGVGTVLNKDDPISRAKADPRHLVHHFRAIERLPDAMHLWERCEEIMRNQDKPAEAAAAARGEVLAETQLPSYLYYLYHRDEMDAGAETSWPAVRPLYWLMRARAASPRAFRTEMQGEPRDDAEKVFHPVRFTIERRPGAIRLGACDPSMGRGETSDPSAILIGEYEPPTPGTPSRLHVIAADIRRRVPSKLEADLIAAQRRHACLAWAFENNNAYEHSRQTFIRAASAAQPPVNLPLIGVTATLEQEVRIESLEPYITDPACPRILIHPALTLLLAELDSWPERQSGHHYDGLCALWLLWEIATRRSYSAGGFRTLARHPHPANRDRAPDDTTRPIATRRLL